VAAGVSATPEIGNYDLRENDRLLLALQPAALVETAAEDRLAVSLYLGTPTLAERAADDWVATSRYPTAILARRAGDPRLVEMFARVDALRVASLTLAVWRFATRPGVVDPVLAIGDSVWDLWAEDPETRGGARAAYGLWVETVVDLGADARWTCAGPLVSINRKESR
jgi:hypothetical protein